MLADYVSKNDDELDTDLLNVVKNIVHEYKRFRYFMAKSTNTNYKGSKKSKGQNAFESQKFMHEFYRDKIFEIVGGDLELAFNLLFAASKEDEKLVFDILDSAIGRLSIMKGVFICRQQVI